VLAILGITLICQLCAGQEITVAAAADLQSAMSGDFFQQIENGAPFDMFFSANLDYPKKLEAAGLIEQGSYYQYARGKIVVWVPNDSKINLNSGLKALIDPR
jgi:molybdate transport system substrate-binding protein